MSGGEDVWRGGGVGVSDVLLGEYSDGDGVDDLEPGRGTKSAVKSTLFGGVGGPPLWAGGPPLWVGGPPLSVGDVDVGLLVSAPCSEVVKVRGLTVSVCCLPGSMERWFISTLPMMSNGTDIFAFLGERRARVEEIIGPICVSGVSVCSNADNAFSVGVGVRLDLLTFNGECTSSCEPMSVIPSSAFNSGVAFFAVSTCHANPTNSLSSGDWPR